MAPTVRPAGVDDIESMRAIGVAAGRRFATADDPRIAVRADDEPFEPDDLQRWIRAGRAWVVGDPAPVGFTVVDVVDGNGHIEEISVDPDHERRGNGGALLEAVSAWARGEGRHALTLTTFADVPWNRPYYERRDFRVMTADEIGPELAARVADEEQAGLPSEIRVCMVRSI